MGTLTTAQARASQTVNPKRQSFFFRPQFNSSSRDEIESLTFRGGDSLVFLRDLNGFTQEQKELTNDEANASLDPQKADFGAYSPVTQTAPIYAKPLGQYADPVEHEFMKMFFSGTMGKSGYAGMIDSGTSTTVFNVASGEGAKFHDGQPVTIRRAANSNLAETATIQSISTDTITLTAPIGGTPANGDTVTSYGSEVKASPTPTTTEFELENIAGFTVGQAIYVGSDVRHIKAISGDKITLNAPASAAPNAGDFIESGNITYYIDDDVPLPLGSMLAQSDVICDLVANMFVGAFNLEAGNDQYLTFSFEIGAIRAYSATHTNFMNIPLPFPDATDVPATTFDTGGVSGLITSGVTNIGATSVTIQLLDTAAVPNGAVVQLGSEQYVTTTNTTTTLGLAEAVRAQIPDATNFTVKRVGICQFQDDGTGIYVNDASVAIGDTEIGMDDGAGANIDVTPVAGTPVYIDGNMYITASGSDQSTLKLTTGVLTTVADDTQIYFATEGTIGLYKAQSLQAYTSIKNSVSNEVMQIGSDGGIEDDGSGTYTYANIDTTTNPHTIKKMWRGMYGTSIGPIADYDECDLYFPTASASTGSPIQARKDVITLIGDYEITNKLVRFGANKQAQADESVRSLDDYAGLPDQDVREFTLECEANYRPEFFDMVYSSKLKKEKQFQTTIGAVKWRRVSLYVPNITLAEPAREGGDRKMSTTIKMNVFGTAETDSRSFFLAYC